MVLIFPSKNAIIDLIDPSKVSKVACFGVCGALGTESGYTLDTISSW